MNTIYLFDINNCPQVPIGAVTFRSNHCSSDPFRVEHNSETRVRVIVGDGYLTSKSSFTLIKHFSMCRQPLRYMYPGYWTAVYIGQKVYAVWRSDVCLHRYTFNRSNNPR